MAALRAGGGHNVGLLTSFLRRRKHLSPAHFVYLQYLHIWRVSLSWWDPRSPGNVCPGIWSVSVRYVLELEESSCG
jgi:hypothetical protein